ncbi:CLAVATA3/ESR (CLE)-related protein 44-like [Forsythia ovata]|uniref:CLAVATA3/ESR (CLE)-related protein 44-like n=1 Tax=Forsythia ovata TaxID=205694 RepID=A0ABD1TS92_9LAMI
MAETSKNACKTFTKSQAILLFLFLLFIASLSIRRFNSPAILASNGRVLLDSDTRNQFNTKFRGGATTFAPPVAAGGGGTTKARSTNREFQVAAHEVPSGGNPIGNI